MLRILRICHRKKTFAPPSASAGFVPAQRSEAAIRQHARHARLQPLGHGRCHVCYGSSTSWPCGEVVHGHAELQARRGRSSNGKYQPVVERPSCEDPPVRENVLVGLPRVPVSLLGKPVRGSQHISRGYRQRLVPLLYIVSELRHADGHAPSIHLVQHSAHELALELEAQRPRRVDVPQREGKIGNISDHGASVQNCPRRVIGHPVDISLNVVHGKIVM
mmetsp:Transcript_31574/g.75668  ORF Transcript_31574/g.75668 Transcript_31574/m.75668 type:complete len:219 (+) Transcript_31574:299-955(+)